MFYTEEIKQKIKETCLENYGVEHPSQSEEIKNKFPLKYRSNVVIDADIRKED